MLYKNILLIDDDPENAEIFMTAADSLNKGVMLRWQVNPQKAMEELRDCENLPELIFLDYNMPRINGLELLVKLKEDKRLRDIPVIVISTPSEVFVKEFLESGKILLYIRKPNSFSELIGILDSIL